MKPIGGISAPASPLLYALSSTIVAHLLVSLTVLTYALSLGAYTRYLYTGGRLVRRFGTLFLGLGLLAHYFALLERSRVLNTVPYPAPSASLSLSAWLLPPPYLP